MAVIQMRIAVTGQQVPGADGGLLWMNPGRDVAHSFPGLLARAVGVMNNPEFTPNRWLAAQGVTQDEVAVGVRWLGRYVDLVKSDDPCDRGLTQNQLLSRSGFAAVHPMVRLAIGEAVMMVMLGAYCHGYRELVNGSPAPAFEVELTPAPAPRLAPFAWLRLAGRDLLHAFSSLKGALSARRRRHAIAGTDAQDGAGGVDA